MLYQGGVDNLAAAERALGDDGEMFHRALKRAQDIIVELMISLDTSGDGDFAANLMRLYEYMHHRLVRANVENDLEIVVEIRGILEELLEAWREAARGSRGEEAEDAPVDVRA